MPRADTCFLLSNLITVDEAIALRDGKSKRSKDIVLDFRCVECRNPVKPHRAGKHMAAHFEHHNRNPDCKLSDPLR